MDAVPWRNVLRQAENEIIQPAGTRSSAPTVRRSPHISARCNSSEDADKSDSATAPSPYIPSALFPRSPGHSYPPPSPLPPRPGSLLIKSRIKTAKPRVRHHAIKQPVRAITRDRGGGRVTAALSMASASSSSCATRRIKLTRLSRSSCEPRLRDAEGGRKGRVRKEPYAECIGFRRGARVKDLTRDTLHFQEPTRRKHAKQ